MPNILPDIFPNTKTELVTPSPKAKLIDKTLVESLALSVLENLYCAQAPRPKRRNRHVPNSSAKNSLID